MIDFDERLTIHSALLLPAGAIAATALTRPNGAEDPTERGLFATRVAYIMPSSNESDNSSKGTYAQNPRKWIE